MKTRLLLVVPLLLSACATKPKPVLGIRSVPGTTLATSAVDRVRYAETLKAYPLARYIDPNNGRIMHEGHTIYRVESSGKWNLHPGSPARLPNEAPRDPAKMKSLGTGELMVELNRQKEVARTVLEGSQAVSQKLGDVSAKLQQSLQLTEQNTRLETEVTATKTRLDQLESEFRQQKQERVVPPIAPTVPNALPGKSDW